VALLILVASLVGAATLVDLRRGPGPAGSRPAGSATAGRPEGTAIVATIPSSSYATPSWSPDGTYFLLENQEDSLVYDLRGRLVWQTYGAVGWLDASHLLRVDGSIVGLGQSGGGAPSPNQWVVANGHGSAAIVVAMPGCVGDPQVDWYRDGGYVRSGEQLTPYGWSTDGRRFIEGHLTCTTDDATLHGWKGRVDVVDFASGTVLATADDVRGPMAMSPAGSWLAAQSDSSLDVVSIGASSSGMSSAWTLGDTSLLGWLDDGHLYVRSSFSGVLLVSPGQAGAGATQQVATGEWELGSAAGARLVVDSMGHALRIVSASSTTLLDLDGLNLTLAEAAIEGTPKSPNSFTTTSLVPARWSPDGRMLLLDSPDGQSLTLISVDPNGAGR
jgi:hypothetical protein